LYEFDDQDEDDGNDERDGAREDRNGTEIALVDKPAPVYYLILNFAGLSA